MSQASGNARDLVALKTSLAQIPKLKAELRQLLDRLAVRHKSRKQTPREIELLAQRIQNEIHEMPALAEKLSKAVVDDPPLALKDGGIFRDGYDPDLDQLRNASREGKNWISELQEREIATTGIKSLKVRYNSVFGYFIEITKSNLASVPDALYPQTNHCWRRTFHHAGVEGNGRKDSRGGRASAKSGIRTFPKIARTKLCASLDRSSKPRKRSPLLDVICSLAETARIV